MHEQGFSERLRRLLEENDLTPAGLSDILGVNRSGISHLLNGRNKPGFDFIERVRESFPELDMEWFLFGTKKKPAPRVYETPKPVDERQSTSIPANSRTEAAKQASLFAENEPEPETRSVQKASAARRLERQVIKTILIYDDGTFEIFKNNFQE